jgi:hypothetical protein
MSPVHKWNPRIMGWFVHSVWHVGYLFQALRLYDTEIYAGPTA